MLVKMPVLEGEYRPFEFMGDRVGSRKTPLPIRGDGRAKQNAPPVLKDCGKGLGKSDNRQQEKYDGRHRYSRQSHPKAGGIL